MTYQTLDLHFQDIPFTLAFDPEYFVSAGMAHIEVRCDEPLPITETGYKSIFIPKDDIPDIRIAAAMVQDHMHRTAQKTSWQADRQLSLF